MLESQSPESVRPPLADGASASDPAPTSHRPRGVPLRVVIAGGGIAGLATAYALRKLGTVRGLDLSIQLFERTERVGGKVVTDREDGYVVEGGPDAFLTTKPWAVQLCRELGLGDRLIPTNPDVRGTFVYAGGRLHRIPDGLRLIAPTQWGPFLRSGLVSWPGKLRMALDLLLPARRSSADESVATFVRRRLGSEALAKLGEPLMAGIYVADAERLSLEATFPQFAELERRHGSLIRGAWLAARQGNSRPQADSKNQPATSPSAPSAQPPGPEFSSIFVSLVGGTAELVEALDQSLGPDVIHVGNGVSEILTLAGQGALDEPTSTAALARTSSASGPTRLRLDDGSVVEADVLVLATPAPIAARLLAAVAPELAGGIAALRHVSSATVSLGFKRSDVPHPLNGTGFVVAAGETLRIRGCTWSSSKFAGRAPDGHVLLRCFVGGAGREGDAELEDAELVTLVRADLGHVLGKPAAPEFQRVYRWLNANPQYDVGHAARRESLEAARPPGLHLVGGAYGGVGVPDCIRQGQEVAARVVESVVAG